MTALFLSFLALLTPPQPTVGRVVYYAPSWGDMTAIAALQGVAVPQGRTCIAVPDCADLGRTGMLSVDGSEWPIIVCDCTAPWDQELVRSRGIIAEVPYAVAEAVPGFVYDGWVTGTLMMEALP